LVPLVEIPNRVLSIAQNRFEKPGAQFRTTANPDKGLGKERHVRAAAGHKVSLCRLKPAFLAKDSGFPHFMGLCALNSSHGCV
jgi:hypothetical protein